MRRLPALVLIVLAPGAGPALAQTAATPAGVTGFYEGVLPCADCSGIRYRLQLRPDKVFILGQEYLGRPAAGSRNSLGLWSESADGRTVVLRDAGEAPVLLAISSPGVLRKLDDEGRPIDSQLDYELRRREPEAPFEPLLRLQGLYSESGAAGIFHECLSRERFPVAAGGDDARLREAYAAARAHTAGEFLVTLDAHIAASGRGVGKDLIVDRFAGLWPGEGCGDPLATAKLLDTYWILTHLGANPVAVPAGAREPYLELKAGGHEITGFGGCNRFMGGFKAEGQALDLGRIAATMMACPKGMEQEQDYFRALQAAASWTILGEHLELYDRQGRMLARFQARYQSSGTGSAG